MKALIGALILVLAGFGLSGAAQACTKPAGAASIEAELVAWINAERGKKGLGKLSNNAALRKAAQRHACDMAQNSFLSHQGSDGSKMATRVRGAGYKYRSVVENVGMDVKAGGARMGQSWKSSPSHWKNLLSGKIEDMGVGFAVNGGNVYYVFVGARKSRRSGSQCHWQGGAEGRCGCGNQCRIGGEAGGGEMLRLGQQVYGAQHWPRAVMDRDVDAGAKAKRGDQRVVEEVFRKFGRGVGDKGPTPRDAMVMPAVRRHRLGA